MGVILSATPPPSAPSRSLRLSPRRTEVLLSGAAECAALMSFHTFKLESDEKFRLRFRFLLVPHVQSSEFSSVQTQHTHIIFITLWAPPSLNRPTPSGVHLGMFVTFRGEYLDFPAAVETTAGLFPPSSFLLIHRNV